MRAYSDVLDAYDKGRYHIAPFRKLRSTSSYLPSDLSYGAGIPIANYYASTPLVPVNMISKEGIFHGASGTDKYLHKITVQQSAPSLGELVLLDYISYIPFLDGDSTDEVIFDDFTLPRFSDGVGVQVMIVTQGQGVGSGNIDMTYTNQSGVPNRTARTALDASVSAGFIFSPRSNFLQLLSGDSGVRSIQKIKFTDAMGGISAIVFVKPIAVVSVSDTLAPIEVDYFTQRMNMPKIHKDAYLNFVFKSLTAVSTNIQAQLEFIW